MLRQYFDRIGFLLRDRHTRAGRATNAVLYILNTAFILLYILSTYDFSAPTLSVIRSLELGLGIVFVGEYVVRAESADDRRAETTNPYPIIDLVAVPPLSVFPGLGAEFLRGLSTLRIFRFLRLVVNERRAFGKSIRVQTIRRLELSVTIFLIFFITTGFIYAAEATRLPEASTAPEVACPRCGASVSVDDRYCRRCGETLVDEQFD